MSDTRLEPMPEELADTRPVVKLVWMSIGDEQVTRYELAERTKLSYATIWRATSELESYGLVDSKPDVSNPSQSLYYRR